MKLSIQVRKTPGRTIVFHHFWCCEFVQSLGFSAFVGGAGDSGLPTQIPEGPTVILAQKTSSLVEAVI